MDGFDLLGCTAACDLCAEVLQRHRLSGDLVKDQIEGGSSGTVFGIEVAGIGRKGAIGKVPEVGRTGHGLFVGGQVSLVQGAEPAGVQRQEEDGQPDIAAFALSGQCGQFIGDGRATIQTMNGDLGLEGITAACMVEVGLADLFQIIAIGR